MRVEKHKPKVTYDLLDLTEEDVVTIAWALGRTSKSTRSDENKKVDGRILPDIDHLYPVLSDLVHY